MNAGPPTERDKAVKQQLVEYLERVPFERAVEQPDFRKLLEEDADSDHPLFPKDAVEAFDEAKDVRRVHRSNPAPALFFSNKSVIIVPGFMGSQLRDDGARGLIWIDPLLAEREDELSALRLREYAPGQPDRDADDGVRVREDGAIPILYAGLRYYLESGRCEVRTAGFDWRVDIDESAARLADTIRSYAAEHPRRPLFVVAHSQGSLVARRALQLMGRDDARRTVNRLILLGPASYGTFSAAFAIAGNHEMIETLAHLGVDWPGDTRKVLQSFTGLYQLLPWKPGTVDPSQVALNNPDFWRPPGADTKRLEKFFGWGAGVDTAFFNDRTSIILGDDPNTPTAAAFNPATNKLEATTFAHGDGTVPDACAVLEGVGDVGRAPGASHMMLPLNRTVMQTVWRIINSNLNVQTLRATGPGAAAAAGDDQDGEFVAVPGAARPAGRGFAPAPDAVRVTRVRVATLPEPSDLRTLAGVRTEPARAGVPEAASEDAPAPPAGPTANGQKALGEPPPAPPHRRLRVFSFDPLLAADPTALGAATIALELPWDEESADAAKLQPGPVGEYLEVVDYDPASGCCYAPVDLNHPNLLAQDGMPPSETDPRFHQQMVYAVGMATIQVFEQALGRTVQWAPYLPRDAAGRVVRAGRPDGEFVRRLRVYPHALREANAYYDPSRKALLFGYFPARSRPGGKVMPAGTVFTCLSFDVVAHEVTHAILDGVNRHLLSGSNRDVLAFHEAFADIVALFQHFSHPEVLRDQVARTGGRVENESMLGRLAQQFGEAMGLHRSLRNYLGQEDKETKEWKPVAPDPTRFETESEPHDRGSILVAAVFTAFRTVYRARTRDLFRIATGGTGVVRPGDLHPDLVNRLSDEAAKVARHLLVMAIRALDYLPPVDLTFGDYLRALITADADLTPPDARLYRAAVVDAFRQWGVYPEDVKTLSADALVWDTPRPLTLTLDMAIFRDILALGNGTLKLDRAEMYRLQQEVKKRLHGWFRDEFTRDPSLAEEWGLTARADPPAAPGGPGTPYTIRRDKDGRPVFEVFSVRRCRRAGPDGQERVDVLVSLLQRRAGYLDEAAQRKADEKPGPWEAEAEGAAPGTPPKFRAGFEPDFWFRGGVTLIIDPRAGRVRYAVYKKITSEPRLAKARDYESGGGGSLGLRGNYFRDDRMNPLALLHAVEDD